MGHFGHTMKEKFMFSVLILDDNKPFADYISRAIEWEKYYCQVIGTIYNGKQGYDVILEKKPDIIISDIEMPGLNGLRMSEMVRLAVPSSKIIFVSAYNNFDYAYRAIKLKAADYLLKPVTKQDLIHAVESVVQVLMHERNESGETEEPSAKTFETKIINYIKLKSCSNISLKEMSEHFGVSVAYMGKLIKQKTGKNFSDLVSFYRVERAKVLLLDGTHRVEEIAELVGYSSYLSFYKVFTREVGTSPTAWCAAAKLEND